MKIKSIPKGFWKSIPTLFGLALAVAFTVAFTPQTAAAQYNTPTVGDGMYLTPKEAPCIPVVVARASSTTEQLIVSSATSSADLTAPGWVNWVLLSTGAADGTNYFEMFDATGTGVAGLNAIGGRFFHASTTQNTYFVLDPPMSFEKGLTGQQSTDGNSATVCVRSSKQQLPKGGG